VLIGEEMESIGLSLLCCRKAIAPLCYQGILWNTDLHPPYPDLSFRQWTDHCSLPRRRTSLLHIHAHVCKFVYDLERVTV
jgi:hypothetical protein